jgi:hypothetical protein
VIALEAYDKGLLGTTLRYPTHSGVGLVPDAEILELAIDPPAGLQHCFLSKPRTYFATA